MFRIAAFVIFVSFALRDEALTRADYVIKTRFGDVYDCVDIQKQPALSHPLLKDHKVKTRPSDALRRTLRAASSHAWSTDEMQNLASVELDDECPMGTVPVRRYQNQNAMVQKPFFLPTNVTGASLFTPGKDFSFAGVAATITSTEKYEGVGARASVYNPKCDDHQVTGAGATLQSTTEGHVGAIQAGWMVNPDLYGDYASHFFVSWMQENNGAIQGCYNLACPGFVQVDPKNPVDGTIQHYSTIGGMQEYIDMRITLDSATGDWWLTYLGDAKEIGYWPKNLFYGLGSGGDQALWGGFVRSSLVYSPAMGSGAYDPSDIGKTSHIFQATVNKRSVFVAPDKERIDVLSSRCYQAGGNKLNSVKIIDYELLFGGPMCHY